MSITAVVQDGAIKLPEDVAWKSGTLVRVETIEPEAPTLFETLEKFDGIAGDLPTNMAEHLDHYLRGRPSLC